MQIIERPIWNGVDPIVGEIPKKHGNAILKICTNKTFPQSPFSSLFVSYNLPTIFFFERSVLDLLNPKESALITVISLHILMAH